MQEKGKQTYMRRIDLLVMHTAVLYWCPGQCKTRPCVNRLWFLDIRWSGLFFCSFKWVIYSLKACNPFLALCIYCPSTEHEGYAISILIKDELRNLEPNTFVCGKALNFYSRDVRLSWPRILAVFLSPSWQIPRQYLDWAATIPSKSFPIHRHSAITLPSGAICRRCSERLWIT
jgi:hypothetical protein